MPPGDGWITGLVAVTAAGRAAAGQLTAAWPGETRTYGGSAGDALPRAFAECHAVVAFLATGAAVRVLAPYLSGKAADPGVVCVDEERRFAVALLGGHAGGANELANRVSAVLGCEPVVTTASDAADVAALDSYGAELGFQVEEGSELAAVGAALVSGQRVTYIADATWPLPALPDNVVTAAAPETGVPAIVVSDRSPVRGPARPGEPPLNESVKSGLVRESVRGQPVDATRPSAGLWTASEEGSVGPAVVYRPPSLVVGVGASRGVAAAEVLALIDAALAEAGLAHRSVRHLATVDVKAGEPGLVEAAERRDWPLVSHPAGTLARVEVPNPSDLVHAEVGTPSVAEAAALCANPNATTSNRTGMEVTSTESASAERITAEGVTAPTVTVPRASGGRSATAELVLAKRKSANATVAVARHPPRGRLALVGLGPGTRELLTPRAAAELRRASVVVGLDQYVDRIRDLLRPGTRVLASDLGAEEQRARTATHHAGRGHAVALVGSGDPGVYAMASPALETAGADVDVVGVPGVTAAQAASALLGAPLGHDHAVISLSDLHTPWETIEARVRVAAIADLVVAFYNPRSRGRDWQLAAALEILAEHRPRATPVGLVRSATRPGEQVTVTALDAADAARADMLTLVIVGASTTRVVAGRMVTPRGYSWSGEPTSEPSGRGRAREAREEASATEECWSGEPEQREVRP